MANPYLKQIIERDAKEQARVSLNRLKAQKGGKFKLSERQYVEEIEYLWLFSEFSAAERIMRAIECDPDMDTKDNIRAALHLFVLDSYQTLKKRYNLKMNVSLEDLIDGKHSTDFIVGVSNATN